MRVSNGLLLITLIFILSALDIFANGPDPTKTPTPTPTSTPVPSPTPKPTPTPVEEWHHICNPGAFCTNSWKIAGDECTVCDGGGATYICELVPGAGTDECKIYPPTNVWYAICSPNTRYCLLYKDPNDPPNVYRCDFQHCHTKIGEECGRWVCFE